MDFLKSLKIIKSLYFCCSNSLNLRKIFKPIDNLTYAPNLVILHINMCMEIYIHNNSTYNFNGKKLLVDIHEWARLSMNSQQYKVFKKEYQEVIDFYHSLDQFSEETIYSTIDSPVYANGKLHIGSRYTFRDSFVSNSLWQEWQDRFASDPNVEYRPLEIER